MSSRKAFCELTEGFHELTEGLFIFRELMEGVSVWKICRVFHELTEAYCELTEASVSSWKM